MFSQFWDQRPAGLTVIAAVDEKQVMLSTFSQIHHPYLLVLHITHLCEERNVKPSFLNIY